jgi:hypothetical protein
MERRRALTLLGGLGIGGSIVVSGSVGSGQRRISVANTDEVPAGTPVELTAEMVDGTATTASPATVQVTMSNGGDERTAVATGWPGVFVAGRSDETGPGLTLVATDRDTRPARSPLCPKAITDYNIPTLLITTELDPGAEATAEFAVWGQRGNDVANCLPEGVFTFRSTYQVSPPSGDAVDRGFSLTVEDGPDS